ncbi:MAG: glycosyltransferase family 4 protein [Cyclobacteriaceae bacterium]
MDREMRVLHMSSEEGWRGGEQQVAYLLEDLLHKNVKNVLAVRAGSRLEHFSREKKISCYTVRFSNSMDFFSAFKINKICRNEKIDIIHLHTSKAQGVGVLSTFYGNRVPMVLSRRVAFLPGKNIFSRWKYNQNQIKKILCVSEKIMTIMQHYVRDRSKCITIYSGIDLGKFTNIKPDRKFLVNEFNLDPERVIIASIGAIDASKDHFTFVDTIERLVASGNAVQGLIIGDGPLSLVLKNYVQTKALDNHVRFAGYRKDVAIILASSDIFLMTSKEEGLGTSLLDAFLARIPVVATDAGGIPEIVRHLETGLLAPVKDSAKLSENVIRLLTDRQLRERLIDQAYGFVKKFSKEETSSKTYKVYQEVLSKVI